MSTVVVGFSSYEFFLIYTFIPVAHKLWLFNDHNNDNNDHDNAVTAVPALEETSLVSFKQMEKRHSLLSRSSF